MTVKADGSYPEFSAEKLWAVMARKRITPRAIATDLGISSRTLGAWLTGENRPRYIAQNAIASYLGVPLSVLLDIDGPPTRKRRTA